MKGWGASEHITFSPNQPHEVSDHTTPTSHTFSCSWPSTFHFQLRPRGAHQLSFQTASSCSPSGSDLTTGSSALAPIVSVTFFPFFAFFGLAFGLPLASLASPFSALRLRPAVDFFGSVFCFSGEGVDTATPSSCSSASTCFFAAPKFAHAVVCARPVAALRPLSVT